MPEKYPAMRLQGVFRGSLNFIGEFELPSAEREPTPEELAERERVAKEQEYNRRRYLKRKASGYYDKPKTAEPQQAALPMAVNQ